MTSEFHEVKLIRHRIMWDLCQKLRKSESFLTSDWFECRVNCDLVLMLSMEGIVWIKAVFNFHGAVLISRFWKWRRSHIILRQKLTAIRVFSFIQPIWVKSSLCPSSDVEHIDQWRSVNHREQAQYIRQQNNTMSPLLRTKKLIVSRFPCWFLDDFRFSRSWYFYPEKFEFKEVNWSNLGKICDTFWFSSQNHSRNVPVRYAWKLFLLPLIAKFFRSNDLIHPKTTIYNE